MPDRIQLRRTKGWRLPEGAISVARPTMWGNPFTVASLREAGYGATATETLQAMCVHDFRDWLLGSDRNWMGEESTLRRAAILYSLPTLRGHDLACWCKPGCPCHADVLIEMANR